MVDETQLCHCFILFMVLIVCFGSLLEWIHSSATDIEIFMTELVNV